MSFLLRVELPDVPGSLGAVATALGEAGADIVAIEVVENHADGRAVDDVLLDLPPPELPDKLVSACQSVDGVRVNWVSRYVSGSNLRMDLEVVESMTERPHAAIEQLVQSLPQTFRADWAIAVQRADDDARVLASTPTAPAYIEQMRGWLALDAVATLAPIDDWRSTVLAGAPVPGADAVVALGRHGGPEILASELARLGHLADLAATIRAPTLSST